MKSADKAAAETMQSVFKKSANTSNAINGFDEK